MLGNHDDVAPGPQGERVRSHPDTGPGLLRRLGRQPRRIDTVLGGKELTMFHATPDASLASTRTTSWCAA